MIDFHHSGDDLHLPVDYPDKFGKVAVHLLHEQVFLEHILQVFILGWYTILAVPDGLSHFAGVYLVSFCKGEIHGHLPFMADEVHDRFQIFFPGQWISCISKELLYNFFITRAFWILKPIQIIPDFLKGFDLVGVYQDPALLGPSIAVGRTKGLFIRIIGGG